MFSFHRFLLRWNCVFVDHRKLEYLEAWVMNDERTANENNLNARRFKHIWNARLENHPVKHAVGGRGVGGLEGVSLNWISSGFKIPGSTRNRVTERVSAPFAACEGIKST